MLRSTERPRERGELPGAETADGLTTATCDGIEELWRVYVEASATPGKEGKISGAVVAERRHGSRDEVLEEGWRRVGRLGGGGEWGHA